MSRAQPVVDLLAERDNRFYETDGPNNGPEIRRWGRLTGYPRGGAPWCAIGMFGNIDDAGLLDLYRPLLTAGTADLARRARAAGWLTTDPARVVPGTIWLNDPNHVELVARRIGPGTALTIGCNVRDGIYPMVRSLLGYRLVTPPGILGLARPVAPTPAYDYGLEDVRAKQTVLWIGRNKANRDRLLDTMLADRRRAYHPRPHRRGEGRNTRYLIIGGPLRWYGPWGTERERYDSLRVLAPRLRRLHKLRPSATVLRPFRVPEPEYLTALAEYREAMARYAARN